MKTFNEYLRTYKFLSENSQQKLEGMKKIRIALLSSFTISGFKEVLFVQCHKENIHADIYVGEYAQYNQEILDPNSSLYQHQPDLIFLFIDAAAFLGDYIFQAYDYSPEDRRVFIDNKLSELINLIRTLEKSSSATVVVHNFETPVYSPMGILEDKQEFGLRESVESFNRSLCVEFRSDPRVYVYDFQSKITQIGRNHLVDDRMYYIGDIKVAFQAINYITADYVSYVKAVLFLSRKCLVLDLDNTLWGGVLGEDGIEGIQLGPSSEGRVFWELQKYILSLYQRGIVLAINSKNNRDDVLEVLRNHPHMILKEEHFASMQINWIDKAQNMVAIADEVNIGLDSIVFVDDDKFNREIVSRAIPEIRVVDLPDDPAGYLTALQKLDDFVVLQLTDEDKLRGKMYAQNRQRKEFERVATDINEYLAGLEMKVVFSEVTDMNLGRLSQLTQKTNQWNMTTKRYTEDEFRAIAKSSKFYIRGMSVKDRFGDNGLVGLIIIEKEDDNWKIDTWLMSCRVIGRRLEEVMLEDVLSAAQSAKIRMLVGTFVPTKKNAPAQDVYKRLGFTELGGKWQYDLRKSFSSPSFIHVEGGVYGAT